MKTQDGPNNTRLAIEHETLPYEKERFVGQSQIVGRSLAISCRFYIASQTRFRLGKFQVRPKFSSSREVS